MTEYEHYDQVDDFRLLIADLDKANQLFTDEQLMSFIRLSGGSLKRGAARALRTMAASEVMLSKKISSQDLSTDGPAVAAELRAQAQALEDEAAAEEKIDIELGTYADYVPFTGSGRCEGEEYNASFW